MTTILYRNALQRKDFYLLCIIWVVAIAIFYPVLYADYLYADEAIQLWQYKPTGPSDFTIATRQGRWITECMYNWMFGAADTVHQLTWLRIFSLLGWILCLPVWYIILKQLVKEKPAYYYLPFFTVLYLVTSLPFSVSIHWSVCLELFFANTMGLVSGFLAYQCVSFTGKRIKIKPVAACMAVITGVLSLFTYQSGFCCFVIPFLIHLLITQFNKKDRVFLAGIFLFPLICIVYYPLFKLSMELTHIANFDRTNIHFDPLHKLEYFFSHPFERSFWFNILVDEDNKLAKAVYKIIFVGWMVLSFVRFGKSNYFKAIKYIVAVMLLFLLSYFPSLIIEENFASNRSQLALNLCVWLVCLETALYFIRNVQVLKVTGVAVACILIISGWYNFRHHFLKPVTAEYATVKQYMQSHYHAGIKTVYFIMLPVDGFKKPFHVNTSMDEFGVPATVFDWTVEYLPRQLVFEITGNRQTGEQLIIKHWPDKESFSRSGESITNSVLLIDLPAIIDPQNIPH
jgi:hypothetical protein